MFTVDKNNKIELIQGDTGILDLSLDNHQLQDGDKVYFTVKASFDSERLIFKEITEFTDGKAKFIFTGNLRKAHSFKYGVDSKIFYN